jgi:hypothetical protein
VRIILAFFIWIVILTGLNLYMKGLNESPQSQAFTFQLREAQAHYALEVTTTFSVEPDPFALQTDTSGESTALLVRLGGKTILHQTGSVEAGVPLRVEPVPGLVQGLNEFYVEASLPMEKTGKSFALRMRLLQDNQPVTDQTFWSDTAGKVAGTFGVTIEAETEKQEQDHAH